MSPDRFDLKLLNLLQKNCLTPLRELSELVNLSMASVQRRIQKLRDHGYVISSMSVLSQKKLQHSMTIIIEVKVNQTYISDLEVLKKLFSSEYIQQSYYVTGEADFILILLVPNIEKLQNICDDLFHNNPKIQSFKTIIVLDSIKTTLEVPISY